MANHVAKLRKALQDAVTIPDIRKIIKVMVQKAKDGDAVAAKIVLERTIGKVVQEIAIAGGIEALYAEPRTLYEALHGSESNGNGHSSLDDRGIHRPAGIPPASTN